MTSTAPRIPTYKRRVSYHTNSSTSFKKKIPKIQEKPAKFATIAHLTLQQCIKQYEGELRELLSPPSTHARTIMGEDGGLELEDCDLSSGDEDEDNNNNNNNSSVEEVEPLWTNRMHGSENAHSTMTPAPAFGRRKIALFDIVTPQHRHEARDVIRTMLRSDCGSGGVLCANIRRTLGEHLTPGAAAAAGGAANHPEDVLAFASALVVETLTMNKYEAMEGLGKCYAGLMDAGRGVLASNNSNSSNMDAAEPTPPHNHKNTTTISDTKNILRSIEVLCLTQLNKATGDALHTLGRLYALCGTARYRRRMVQRIGPLLLRPPYSAPYSVQHMADMEAALVVAEVILRHSHSIFGEGWYARGAAIREDEVRLHTIQAAAGYLQSLPVSSSAAAAAASSRHDRHPHLGSAGYYLGSSGAGGGTSVEVQKLDMLIRSTIMGVSRSTCSYALSSHPGGTGAAAGGGNHTVGAAAGGAYSSKKCPLSPRVKLPQPEVTPAPSGAVTGTNTAGAAASGAITGGSGSGDVSPTQQLLQQSQLPAAAPLTPKPSIPSYYDCYGSIATPRSPSSPPKSPYMTHHHHRTNSSSRQQYGSIHHHHGQRQHHHHLLDSTERTRTVMACRALRQQISAYEDRFEQAHRRPPKKPADKAPFASTYAQYREWKRVIRSDAARRIQAVWRGFLCRKGILNGAHRSNDKDRYEDCNAALVALVKRNNCVWRRLRVPKVMHTDINGGNGVLSEDGGGVEVVVGGLPQPRSNALGQHHHGAFGGQHHRPQYHQQQQQHHRVGSTSSSTSTTTTGIPSMNTGGGVMMMHPNAAPGQYGQQGGSRTAASGTAPSSSSAGGGGNNQQRRVHSARQQQQQPSAYVVQQQQQQQQQQLQPVMDQHPHPSAHYTNSNNSHHMNAAAAAAGGGNSNHRHPSNPPTMMHRHHSNESSIGSNDSSDDSSSGLSRSRGIKELLRQKRELKAQLKQYDNTFKRQHGRMPVKAEKEPIRHLYETYNTLKAKISMLEAGEGGGGIHMGGSVGSYEGSPSSLSLGGHRSPRTPTPPPPLNINAAGGGGTSPNTNTLGSYGGAAVQDMAMLRQEKGQLHQMLRTYEKDFYQAHGRQVSSFEDIRPVASQYRRYKEIKRAINALQEEERSMGRTSL